MALAVRSGATPLGMPSGWVPARAAGPLAPAPVCSSDGGGHSPAAPYSTPACLVPSPVAGEGGLVVEALPLTFGGHTYPHSRIAFVRGRPPAPVVLVHPNYAGLKQFDVDTACFLARAGYVGFALDLYKDVPEYTFADRNPEKGAGGELASTHDRHFQGAFAAMNALLLEPKYWRGLMQAYLEAAFAHPAVRAGLAGAIGYCFGGQCLLEQVRAGHQLQSVVSFHGLLQSMPLKTPFTGGRPQDRLSVAEFASQIDAAPNSYATGCRVLIENGDLDDHVPLESVDEWKGEMDAHGIDWRFYNHAQTPHGFALAPGVYSTSYHEAADRRSTLSMLSLFAEVWPEFQQHPVDCNASGTALGQSIVLLGLLGRPRARL